MVSWSKYMFGKASSLFQQIIMHRICVVLPILVQTSDSVIDLSGYVAKYITFTK